MNGASAVRLATELANQFRHLPVDEAAARIAQHIRAFWEPRLRAELVDDVREVGGGIDPIVSKVANLLGG